VRLRLEATITATPEKVWAVASDWERYPRWMPDVASVRRVAGEPGVGLELDVRTKILGLPLVTDRMTVREWEPPRVIGIEHHGIVSGPARWVLLPERGGAATRLLWTEDIHMPPPVLGELALRIYAPVLRVIFRKSMRNLAEVATRS
jgi:carbon monoxide dehydrogenase subunit G